MTLTLLLASLLHRGLRPPAYHWIRDPTIWLIFRQIHLQTIAFLNFSMTTLFDLFSHKQFYFVPTSTVPQVVFQTRYLKGRLLELKFSPKVYFTVHEILECSVERNRNFSWNNPLIPNAPKTFFAGRIKIQRKAHLGCKGKGLLIILGGEKRFFPL